MSSSPVKTKPKCRACCPANGWGDVLCGCSTSSWISKVLILEARRPIRALEAIKSAHETSRNSFWMQMKENETSSRTSTSKYFRRSPPALPVSSNGATTAFELQNKRRKHVSAKEFQQKVWDLSFQRRRREFPVQVKVSEGEGKASIAFSISLLGSL